MEVFIMGMDINGISNVTPKALTSNEPSNIENKETPVRINSINKKMRFAPHFLFFVFTGLFDSRIRFMIQRITK